jgi:hypothetical protein
VSKVDVRIIDLLELDVAVAPNPPECGEVMASSSEAGPIGICSFRLLGRYETGLKSSKFFYRNCKIQTAAQHFETACRLISTIA